MPFRQALPHTFALFQDLIVSAAVCLARVGVDAASGVIIDLLLLGSRGIIHLQLALSVCHATDEGGGGSLAAVLWTLSEVVALAMLAPMH